MKSQSTTRIFARSLAMGVLISMVSFYLIHVFGTWTVENYRPDPDTTSTVLLHNKCLALGLTHTLRPNTDISAMDESVDGTKLAGSFMIFFEGHIAAIVIFAIVIGGIIFFFWNSARKKKITQAVS